MVEEIFPIANMLIYNSNALELTYSAYIMGLLWPMTSSNVLLETRIQFQMNPYVQKPHF